MPRPVFADAFWAIRRPLPPKPRLTRALHAAPSSPDTLPGAPTAPIAPLHEGLSRPGGASAVRRFSDSHLIAVSHIPNPASGDTRPSQDPPSQWPCLHFGRAPSMPTAAGTVRASHPVPNRPVPNRPAIPGHARHGRIPCSGLLFDCELTTYMSNQDVYIRTIAQASGCGSQPLTASRCFWQGVTSMTRQACTQPFTAREGRACRKACRFLDRYHWQRMWRWTKRLAIDVCSRNPARRASMQARTSAASLSPAPPAE